jgi:hypothetical protein
MYLVNKGTRLNLRITEAFRADLEALAEYHGLSLSSYAHSLLVKAVRRELQETPIKNFNHVEPTGSKQVPFEPGRKKLKKTG